MKSRVIVWSVVLVVGLVCLAVSASAGVKSVRLATNMNTGDQAMANACIAKFNADGTAGTRELLQRMEVENYLLSKVQLRERKQAPSRVRLGFNFHNKLEVITVYMEADCPSDLVDPHLPARSAKADSK